MFQPSDRALRLDSGRPLRRAVVFGRLCLVLLAFPSLPAAADILVTKDGQQIETKGPWEIKGRQLVFTSAKGVLSAMRLAEVDLEASELATHPPEPSPAPPPAKDPDKLRLGDMSQASHAAPVLVLTNEDVGRATSQEVEELAKVFGGAMMELTRAIAQEMTADSDDPELADAVDRELDGRESELRRGYEEALVALAAIAERYPDLENFDPNSSKSRQEHAGSADAAAKELRVAALQAQTAIGRQMLDQIAAQLEAVAARN